MFGSILFFVARRSFCQCSDILIPWLQDPMLFRLIIILTISSRPICVMYLN